MVDEVDQKKCAAGVDTTNSTVSRANESWMPKRDHRGGGGPSIEVF